MANRKLADHLKSLNGETFLGVLRQDPLDTTTRLVYADWLEENGQEAEARKQRSLTELLQAQPQDSTAHERHAAALRAAGLEDEAQGHEDIARRLRLEQTARSFEETEAAGEEYDWSNHIPTELAYERMESVPLSTALTVNGVTYHVMAQLKYRVPGNENDDVYVVKVTWFENGEAVYSVQHFFEEGLTRLAGRFLDEDVDDAVYDWLEMVTIPEDEDEDDLDEYDMTGAGDQP